MIKNKLQKREYHDGDIVEFDFEPNSLDIYWHKVTIIGVITGILCEKDCIHYEVQLRDNKRGIFGDIVVPEDKINRKMADSIVTIKCDFCDIRAHVNKKDGEDIERKTRGWERLYCVGKEHHVLNVCRRCMEIQGDLYDKKWRCPYDQSDTMPEKEKENILK